MFGDPCVNVCASEPWSLILGTGIA